MSFTYSGYRSGAFSATGAPPDVRTGTRWAVPWAAASNFTIRSTYTELTATQPSGARSLIVDFVVPSAVTGTFALGRVHSDGLVFSDGLIFEYNPTTGVGERYLFTPGTVSISAVAADRVTGTFSGSAVDSLNHRTIDVTGGSFDVAIDQP